MQLELLELEVQSIFCMIFASHQQLNFPSCYHFKMKELNLKRSVSYSRKVKYCSKQRKPSSFNCSKLLWRVATSCHSVNCKQLETIYSKTVKFLLLSALLFALEELTILSVFHNATHLPLQAIDVCCCYCNSETCLLWCLVWVWKNCV